LGGTHRNDLLAHWVGRVFGPLISPGRGLFVFCPIFRFSLVGLALTLRARAISRFDGLYLAVIGCHVVIVALSILVGWTSFGARFMTDIVPMLVYFLLPAMVYVAANLRTAAGSIMASLMAAAVVSLMINAQGAFNPAVSDWNPNPSILTVPKVTGGSGTGVTYSPCAARASIRHTRVFSSSGLLTRAGAGRGHP
jgi:hypothetical protein